MARKKNRRMFTRAERRARSAAAAVEDPAARLAREDRADLRAHGIPDNAPAELLAEAYRGRGGRT